MFEPPRSMSTTTSTTTFPEPPSSTSSHSPMIRPTTPLTQQARMASRQAPYHPFLFASMSLCALAELGLTTFLFSKGNEAQTWPSALYHILLIFYLFNAAWTATFSSAYILWMLDAGGGVYWLASAASSVFWLLVTTALWGTSAALMYHSRTRGDTCPKRSLVSRCRQSLAVEALGWTESGLCTIALMFTLWWVVVARRRGKRASFGSDSRTFV